MNKVLTASQFNKLQIQEETIIFTNGCFDIFHAGHVHLLTWAKSIGGVLVVGLNSDESTKLNKGHLRPIIPQEQRAEVLSALESVDYIIIFDELTPKELIDVIHPDVLVKGGDWEAQNIVGADVVKEVYRVEFERDISTTKIIEKIFKGYYEWKLSDIK